MNILKKPTFIQFHCYLIYLIIIMNKLAIIDYGLGNLFGLKQACSAVGLETVITNEKKEISHPGCWGLISGALNSNENPYRGIKREIKEELLINIRILYQLASVKHKDDKIDVEVHYFLCESLNKNIVLSEQEDMKWVQKNELLNFKMAPGDSKIIKYLD